jgi:hypothetical protein
MLLKCKVYFKMNSTEVLPENLIVSVRIPKSNKSSIITLPKAAILSNEIETDYWVMLLKMTLTAVKVQIGFKKSRKNRNNFARSTHKRHRQLSCSVV